LYYFHLIFSGFAEKRLHNTHNRTCEYYIYRSYAVYTDGQSEIDMSTALRAPKCFIIFYWFLRLFKCPTN